MPGSPDGNSANDKRFSEQERKRLQDAANEYKASGEMERQRIADDEAFERRKLEMKQIAAEAKIRSDIRRRWAKVAYEEANSSMYLPRNRTHKRNEILKDEIIGAPYIPVEVPRHALGKEYRKAKFRFTRNQIDELLTMRNRSSRNSRGSSSSSKSGSTSKSHGSSSKSSGGKKKRKTRKFRR